MYVYKAILSSSLLILLNQNLHAEKALLPDEAFLDPEILFSDASNIPTKREKLTVPVTIITREMIEATGAINVAELFRLVPGYQVGLANRGNIAVSPHDVTDRFVKNLEVRVDGIPIYEINNNAPNWSTSGVRVEDIERIEITRAPNSVTHGFNSFMGSVNIITRSPLQEHGTYGLFRYGSDDYQHYQLRHSNRVDDVSFRVGVDYKTEDGFEDLGDEADVSNFKFRGLYTPSVRNEIDFGVTLAHNDFQQVFTTPDTTGNIELESPIEQTGTLEYVKWQHIKSNSDVLRVEFNHRYTHLDESPTLPFGTSNISTLFPPGVFNFLFPGQPDQVVNFVYRATEHRYDTNVSYLYNQIENVRLHVGADLRYETLEASYIRNNRQSRFSKSLFTSVDWDITSALLLNAGLSAQFTNDNTPTFSPRLGFNYSLNNSQAIRGNVSYSEKSPGITVQNSSTVVTLRDGTPVSTLTVSDPDIDNISMFSYGIGYHGNYFRDKLEVDVQLYRQEVQEGPNFFYTNLPPLQFPGAYFDNALDWNGTGLETEILFHLSQDAFLRINYAYIDVYGTGKTGINPATFQNLDDAMAKHSLGVLASKKWNNGFGLSSAYYYQSNMRWRTESTREDVNRLDIKGSYKHHFGDSSVELAVIGQGLLGDYYELQIGNKFEPRGFFQASIKF